MNDRPPSERDGSSGIPENAGQPLVRLATGGSRLPVGIAVAIVVLLAGLVWQPWSRSAPTARPVASVPTASAPVAVAAPPTSAQPSAVELAETANYLSLVDNEWTVVALLSPTEVVPGEEPALPHPTDALGTAPPLLVLQQGIVESSQIIERPRHPDLPCQSKAVPRDRTAVPLPADRVLYLGVTFPGMNPAAKVTAVDLDRAGLVLDRVPSLVVSLSGQPTDASYRLPNEGPGAVVLFALPRGMILPNASYKFEVDAPGLGHRYLYACVGA